VKIIVSLSTNRFGSRLIFPFGKLSLNLGRRYSVFRWAGKPSDNENYIYEIQQDNPQAIFQSVL